MGKGYIPCKPVSPKEEKYKTNLPCSTASIGSSIIEFICVLSEEETGRIDDVTSTGATKSINTPSAELILLCVSLVPAAEGLARLALCLSATVPGDSSVNLE
jgi:hypothetical protein